MLFSWAIAVGGWRKAHGRASAGLSVVDSRSRRSVLAGVIGAPRVGGLRPGPRWPATGVIVDLRLRLHLGDDRLAEPHRVEHPHVLLHVLELLRRALLAGGDEDQVVAELGRHHVGHLERLERERGLGERLDHRPGPREEVQVAAVLLRRAGRVLLGVGRRTVRRSWSPWPAPSRARRRSAGSAATAFAASCSTTCLIAAELLRRVLLLGLVGARASSGCAGRGPSCRRTRPGCRRTVASAPRRCPAA